MNSRSRKRVPAFLNRAEAGRLLGARLLDELGRADVLVLGLPRGGVAVAGEVSRVLGAPLDVFMVRKLGVPGHEELAMGAIASGRICVLNQDTIARLGIDEDVVQQVIQAETVELERRERLYRAGRPPVDGSGRTVILVDDGLATGATMRAAVKALRRLGPARIIVAVPVAAPAALEELRHVADDCVCLMTPEPFYAVGIWYEDFSQTTDEEVQAILARNNTSSSKRPAINHC